MTLTYALKNEDVHDFNRAQELTKGIASNLKKLCDGISENCVVIFFSCFSIYPTFDGMVDGFNMDILFTRLHMWLLLLYHWLL